MRRRQNDIVRRRAQQFDRKGRNRADQGIVLRAFNLPALRHHHQSFGTLPGRRNAEYRNTATSNAIQAANGLFQFVGVKIAPATNDHVLEPAGEDDIPLGQIP